MMNGQDITFEVANQAGKPAKGYLALPSEPDGPGVIVLHAWWGLNAFFKGLCNRLASDGFVAFAPDLNDGKVAMTVEEAKQLMSESNHERKHAIVAALVDFMGSRPEVQKGPLSLVGFSMGAAWSLVLAGERAQDIRKVVLFYGTQNDDFTKIKAEVLGHYSDSDEWEPIDDVRAMEADMQKAGLNTNFHVYSNLNHWFFEDDRPEFDSEAAEVAWKRTLEFLRK